MNRYKRTVMACLRTARDDRTFWTPIEDPKEKTAVHSLVADGLVIFIRDKGNQRCFWVAPTREGLKHLRETDDQCQPTS